MKSIEYAIKVKDEFLGFGWDYKYEWDTVYKGELHEYNCIDMLFNSYEDAYNKMQELIANIQEFNSVDGLTLKDIEDVRIVKVEKVFECNVVEL